MSKGSGSRRFNKSGEDAVRKNAFWDSCEFKLKQGKKDGTQKTS